MIAAADVKTWLGLTGTEQDAHTQTVVEATNAFVASLPVVAGLETWPAHVRLAAIMLAGRLVRRRNSPSGVEALTDAGTSYVSRYDPDVARMLEIDGYQRPQVG